MMSHPPGTIFVLRSGGTMGFAIRLLTRSRVNHAGICLGNGDTVEAQAKGAVRKFEQGPSERITYGTELIQRIEKMAPGRGLRIALEAESLLGREYNYLDLVALAWEGLHHDPTEIPEKPNWWESRVMRDDRLICSQLVDLAYRRAGVHLFNDGRLPGQVTPGDIESVIANPDWPVTISA